MNDTPSNIQMGQQRAVAGVNLTLAAVKVYMLSDPPASNMCFNFFKRHHALDAHTTNFYTAAISRFPILLIKILAVFRLTFSILIFCILAGWTKFFPASLMIGTIDVWRQNTKKEQKHQFTNQKPETSNGLVH